MNPAPRNFALIGAAGFVAPRHLCAIRDTGSRLVAALDPHDSVGILDEHFPAARFFTDPEDFAALLAASRGEPSARVDFVSVASPSHLHLEHCRVALEHGASVICEKPLALGRAELDELERCEARSEGRVFTVLQLRHMPSLVQLRERVRAMPERRFDVELSYVTRRGPWYHASWKGDPRRSGGLAMNIGIHFFDLLLWCFGPARNATVTQSSSGRMRGELELERASVRWHLSVGEDDLPRRVVESGGSAYRALRLDGELVEFSSGFEHLHTRVYRDALSGHGHGISEARAAIELVEAMTR